MGKMATNISTIIICQHKYMQTTTLGPSLE